MKAEHIANYRERNMRLMSLYFLLYFAAGGFILPFLSLYFQKIQLNGIQIGAIGTIGGLMGLIGAPFWGFVFDRAKYKLYIIQFTMILASLFLLLMGHVTLFWSVVVFFALYRFWGSSHISTAENLAFNLARPNEGQKKNGFGSMRLWGSLSWAGTSLLGGWMIERFNIQINMFAYVTFCVLAAALLFLFPREAFKTPESERNDEQSDSMLRTILKDKVLLIMVIALALSHPMGNGIRQFEAIYMYELGISESLIGTAAMLSALLEVPFMFWADHLIERWGVSKVLIIIFSIDVLRRLLVYWFPQGWMVFGMQVAMSITFSLRLVSAVNIVNQRIPQKFTNTALAFITVTVFGISNMISSAVSGVIYEAYSGRELYLMSAIGCLISLFLAFYASRILKKSKKLQAHNHGM